MPNSYVNSDLVAAESVRLLENGLKFTSLINQKYSKSFEAPASMGEDIRIRVPFNSTTRDGATAVPQSFAEQYRTLKISIQKGSDLEFSSIEKKLDIKEFSERVLRNEMVNLAAVVDADNLTLVNEVPNLISVASLTQTQIRQAKATLAANLCPIDNRLAFFINPIDEVKILTGTETFFNAGKAIEDQYMKSAMGKAMGFTFYESNLIPNLEIGTNAVRTVAVSASMVDGATTLVLKNLTAAGTVKKGEIFTIAGVKDVNYQLKTVKPNDKQFVVLEDATAVAGVVTLKVYQTYGPGTAGLQTVSALPTVDDVVTFVGVANASYPQSFAFHPDFATVAFVNPEVPGGVNAGSKYEQNSVYMRYVEQFLGGTDKYLHRFDVYYGRTMLRSEYAVRVVEI